MIRSAKEDEIERLIEIWFDASCAAHDFIQPDYWESQKGAMRECYLPLSSNIVFVHDESGEILGFMSLIDDFLAGIFVAPSAQRQGIGVRLLRLACKIHPTLSLRVYEKNIAARAFYEKHGFLCVETRREEGTGERELLLVRSV